MPPEHEIVSRQCVIQVVGPSGEVDIGQATRHSHNMEVETIESKRADGSNALLVGNQEFPNGTIDVGEYDGAMARLMDGAMHPGSTDPIRHILVFTEEYNDGTSQTLIAKGVLFFRNGKTIERGSAVSNASEWKGEEWELL